VEATKVGALSKTQLAAFIDSNIWNRYPEFVPAARSRFPALV